MTCFTKVLDQPKVTRAYLETRTQRRSAARTYLKILEPSSWSLITITNHHIGNGTGAFGSDDFIYQLEVPPGENRWIDGLQL